MKWSRSAWASADPSVGSVPAPSSSSSTRQPGPAPSTMRTIERRWPLNVDSDCATDCSSPMSANTSRKTGRTLPVGGRHVEPRLVHQRQQADGPERDRLAAGVGTGDDDRGVVAAQAHVDGHHAAGQPRVARGEQHHLGPGRGLRADRVQLRREAGLGRPEVEPSQGLECLAAGRRPAHPRAPTARRGCAPPRPGP